MHSLYEGMLLYRPLSHRFNELNHHIVTYYIPKYYFMILTIALGVC